MRKPIFETNQFVAVYGTLKKGYGNHRLLNNASYIGNGRTAEKYRLCVSGLPFLLDGKSDEGHNVKVEVYSCNPFEMYSLDLLEGHPRFYKRKRTDIKLNDGHTVDAWVYFVPDNLHYNNGEYVESYEGAHNDIDEQIQTQY